MLQILQFKSYFLLKQFHRVIIYFAMMLHFVSKINIVVICLRNLYVHVHISMYLIGRVQNHKN
jgi:hypothetical protein